MASILVADDEEGIREFLAMALEADGHRVHTSSDGEAACTRIQQQSFDLLVTDLKMPRMDGMALLSRAKEMDPALEIIVLTAHGAVDVAVRAMKLGAFDFLQKPLEGPDELRALVSRALEHRSLLTLRERTSRSEKELPPLTYGDPRMESTALALQKVAKTDATVLLLGESGTGKEIAAQSVHRWSKRRDGPFVAINCAALSESLVEAELFGHEKGSFTGAASTRRGRIELAQGGTLFLDEVGELKSGLQAKLLRVLQERQFERVGGARTILADIRVIAATNRSLEGMIRSGEFREDLYHRLAVFPVVLPPLRERTEDLLPIARALLVETAAAVGKRNLRLSPDGEQAVLRAPWKGNVRELRNALERGAIVCADEVIDAADLQLDFGWGATAVTANRSSAPVVPAEGASLEAIERAAIAHALALSEGNRRIAAARLGIGLRTLYDKLKRYHIP